MSRIMRPRTEIYYPDSDGQPMADNTLQFDWIGALQGGLARQYDGDPRVFVAGDHLIYPVEGNNKLRQAPDVYVAFGRPKGHRGSYQVWEEAGIFPQVVFEVWSPNNKADQMELKKAFYLRYGAEEYYILYPDFPCHADGFLRDGGVFVQVPGMNGFVSPRLGIRFEVGPHRLAVFGRDGREFKPTAAVAADRDAAEERAEAERQRAEAERQRAEEEARRTAEERKRADDERQRAEDGARALAAERDQTAKLKAKLRELGLDPDAD